MKNATTPNLEPPGAGLRKREQIIMGTLFPLLCRFKSRESLATLFRKEEQTILELLSQLSETQARQPILIKRIRGIEDSSRNWSAYMTLSHLHIVNLGIAGIIRNLGREKSIDIEVRTQDVKPSPDTGPEIIPDFKKSASLLQKTIASIENLDTSFTHHHPWFGPLNPKGWHTLTAIHMTIHRKQLQLIIKQLK